MTHLSRLVVDYALGQNTFDARAVASAKTFILDSLGVGIAGSKAPFRASVLRAVQAWGHGDAAHIWGDGQKAPTASAAFLNGFQIHAMEFDCVHEPAVVHPMATILAALSAEADTQSAVPGQSTVSGQDFIHAVIIAVDIAVELGVAVTSPLKFFRPATAGLFGATLGIARLRGFDTDTALSAMGCALAQCAGVMQAHVEGKPTLPVQIAGAARAAIVACDLAQARLAGPEHALEGPFGYFAMFEDDADLEALVAHLGRVHRISEVSWKPFPTGRAAQGGITLVQTLIDKGLTLDNLDALTLSAPPIIPRLVDRPVFNGMSANYARLCFPYLAIITLMRGTVSLQDFTEGDLSHPDILGAAERISVTTNHETNPAAFTPQSMTALLKDGRRIEAHIDKLFGSPAFPLTPDQHIEKFRKCIAFGLSDINAERVASGLITAIDNLEQVDSCANIFALASGL